MDPLENLDTQTQSVAANRCVITAKVNDKLKQSYGIVHSGINSVLAETAVSLGANQWLADCQQDQIALGVNITTEHLVAVSNGKLRVITIPIKRGQRIQTWQVDIHCNDRCTSTSMVTLINQPRS